MKLSDYAGNGIVALDGRRYVLCSCKDAAFGPLPNPGEAIAGEEWCQLPAMDLEEPEVGVGSYRYGMLEFRNVKGRAVPHVFSRAGTGSLYDIYEDDFVHGESEW